MRHKTWITFATLLALGSVSLRAQSVPVLAVKFEGNSQIDAARLKSQLRAVREGGWYNPDAMTAELRNLEGFYQDEGFLRVKIGPPSVELQNVPGRGQAAIIVIRISEGSRYMLGDLTVKNAQAFKPETLLRLAPLKSGQPYSRKKIARWQEKIEDAYNTMGYIRVQTQVHEETHELRKTVDSVLECREGQSFRVGKITVAGDDSINLAEFKKQILVGEGSLYNPEMLVYTVHFLNAMRIYRPISQSDIEIRIDDERATVDLVFRVTLLPKSS